MSILLDDRAHQLYQQAGADLSDRVLAFTMQEYGPQALEDAWFEFNLYAEETPPFSGDSIHLQVFLPWFLYRWVPDSEDAPAYPRALRRLSPGAAYLKQRGEHLDAPRRKYLKACLAACFSFYEIEGAVPEQSLRLRDVLTGTLHEVQEKKGSAHARVGDLLFGQIVDLDLLAVLDGCSAIAFPPMWKPELIDYRVMEEEQEGPLHKNHVRECFPDLLDYYHDFMLRAQNPRPPKLANTDGEPILPHTLRFAIESPEQAFAALKDLTLTQDEDDLLAGAEREAGGALRKIDLPWQKPGNASHPGWTNTVLGHLRIDGSKLVAEVNSAPRAQRVREEIEARLGERVEHLETTIHRLDESIGHEPDEAQESHLDNDELNAQPEVRAQVAQMLRNHYLAWVDTPVPMLSGHTPREAMHMPGQRGKVEAMLAELEREARSGATPLAVDTVTEVRALLASEDADASEASAAQPAAPEPQARIRIPEYSARYLGSLSPDALVRLLEADEDRVLRNVIETCAGHADAMVHALRPLADRPSHEDATEGEWWLRIHACMIAGLIPSAAAGELLWALLLQIDEDEDLDEWISGRWPALFANKPDSLIARARAIAESGELQWPTRWQAMEIALARAQIHGEAALSETLEWIARIAGDEARDWSVRGAAAHHLMSFPREAHRPLLLRLAKEQVKLEFRDFDERDVHKVYRAGEDTPQWLEPAFADPWSLYDPAEIRERLERRASEEQEADPFDGEPSGDALTDEEADDIFGELESAPLVRTGPKIGRNEPCPCGSGKKYKKCCLARDTAA
jgi:hypothetical protein